MLGSKAHAVLTGFYVGGKDPNQVYDFEVGTILTKLIPSHFAEFSETSFHSHPG